MALAAQVATVQDILLLHRCYYWAFVDQASATPGSYNDEVLVSALAEATNRAGATLFHQGLAGTLARDGVSSPIAEACNHLGVSKELPSFSRLSDSDVRELVLRSGRLLMLACLAFDLDRGRVKPSPKDQANTAMSLLAGGLYDPFILSMVEAKFEPYLPKVPVELDFGWVASLTRKIWHVNDDCSTLSALSLTGILVAAEYEAAVALMKYFRNPGTVGRVRQAVDNLDFLVNSQVSSLPVPTAPVPVGDRAINVASAVNLLSRGFSRGAVAWNKLLSQTVIEGPSGGTAVVSVEWPLAPDLVMVDYTHKERFEYQRNPVSFICSQYRADRLSHRGRRVRTLLQALDTGLALESEIYRLASRATEFGSLAIETGAAEFLAARLSGEGEVSVERLVALASTMAVLHYFLRPPRG
jgi:hypothetical protein